MELWRALGLLPNEVLSLVGGGGKTSLAGVLLRELPPGRRAIFTTTTRVWPDPALPQVLVEEDPGWEETLGRALAAEGRALLAAGRRTDGKLAGVSPDLVGRLKQARVADLIAVEADGSAGRPLKAPAEHEPVVPPDTDVLLAVVGLQALGKPVIARYVHRPEVAAGLLAGGEARLTEEGIARILLHPRGVTKGRPATARLAVAINQVDSPVDLDAAAGLARRLVDAGAPRVVLTSASGLPAVRGLAGPVVAVVLAAGASRRFGAPKQLARVGGGPGNATVLERSLEAACRAPVAGVWVVTGAHGDLVRPMLERYPVQVVDNPAYRAGMSSSLRAGLEAVLAAGAGGGAAPRAVLVVLADQPFLTREVYDRLVGAYLSTGARIVHPVAGGRRCNPVLFDLDLAGELLAVEGDEGGRRVLAAHPDEALAVEFRNPATFRDVDYPEDIEGEGE